MAGSTMMKTVSLSERVTKSQNKLFEHAHSQPLELKYLGIALSKQGLQGERWYAHPEMIPMPIRKCNYLSTLTQRQKSIISACYFANLYKFIANSETQTLISNMAAAEKSFAPFSDEYMVLHQETCEEADHIWTFRTIYNTVCRETGTPDSFDAPGFFHGIVGAMLREDYEVVNADTRYQLANDFQELFSLLKQGKGAMRSLLEQFKGADRTWRYRALRFLIGDAIRMFSPEEVQEMGLGGLWLLYRYVANVDLKQAESYLFDSPQDFDYEPIAYEINQAHVNDEARHYTTSYEIGLAMYRAASQEAQEFIREAIKIVVEDYVNVAFMTHLEKLDETDNGFVFTAVEMGVNSLRMALHHPEFKDKQVDAQEVANSWKQMQWRKMVFPMTQKRWRYMAQQFDRVLKALDVELGRERMGNTYDRYHYFLGAEPTDHYIEMP
jgi:hypothetical protein